MTQDHGASVPDRAAGLQPQPPAASSQSSIPSAVTLITLRDTIRAVPGEWRKVYATGHYATDAGKQGILRGLELLDVETCTSDQIAEVIGNRSWTENRCDVCDNPECEIIARLGDEPGYESRWQDICLPCLVDLGAWAASAMSAEGQDPQGLGAQPASAAPEGGAQ